MAALHSTPPVQRISDHTADFIYFRNLKFGLASSQELPPVVPWKELNLIKNFSFQRVFLFEISSLAHSSTETLFLKTTISDSEGLKTGMKT